VQEIRAWIFRIGMFTFKPIHEFNIIIAQIYFFAYKGCLHIYKYGFQLNLMFTGFIFS